MPGRSMPTWRLKSRSQLAFLGYAMIFAGFASAAGLGAPPKGGAGASAGLFEAVLSVIVNKEAIPDTIVALRDPAGRIFISATDLTEWRLRLPEAAPMLFKGARYYPLSSLPGLVTSVDEATQTLTVDAPASLFGSTELDALGARGPVPDRSAFGGFLNYSLLATRSDNETSYAGSFELDAFGRWGNAATTGVASHGAGSTTFTRLESTWTYAMPEQTATVRAGDVISRAGAWGRSIRYGGVQYATDFDTQPTLVRAPVQFAAGQATVPSTVDVFVNNSLVTQQQVKPGPFSVTNIPPISGAGDVTLVVRDELGREQIVTRPFYSSPTLLRRGLSDFSYDFGLERENFGISSFDYGAWTGSGTYRYGVTDQWTGELRGEARPGLANVGVASDFLIRDFGIVSGSLAGGRSSGAFGTRASLGFERQSKDLSFSIQGDWASADFRQVGDSDPQVDVAHEWIVSTGYTFGRYGTIAGAYVSRTLRDQSKTTIGSLGYTFNLDRLGSVGVSISRIRAEDLTTTTSLIWTVPLGDFTSASLTIDRTRNATLGNRDERTLAVQRDLPVGQGFGYRVQASQGGPRQAELDYQNRYGTYGVEVAQADGQTAERVSASGGIGIIDGHAFANRTINDSFGLVRLPGYPDVRVYAQNQEVGRTDAAGELIVPQLLPYYRNTIRIEQADLPFDAEFDVLAHDAVPYFRGGVVTEFRVRPARGALVRIVQDDSAVVPAGAMVRLDGNDTVFPVAVGGEAYLAGLLPRNHATATWRDHECSFEFDYPETRDPQPRLGTFTCRSLH
jgi:outer membrane usher protein